MQKQKKTAFELPFAGIDHFGQLVLLYGTGGDFSVVMQVKNPVLQYCADEESYLGFQNILLNAIKILGEGYLIQKQDVFVRKAYQGRAEKGFLQQKYHEHFSGRAYTKLLTYITITRQVKRKAFYTYDRKVLVDFAQGIEKLFDLFSGAGLGPSHLSETEINHYVTRILGMDFSGSGLALDNLRCTEEEIFIGPKAVRCISLINTDTIDLPEKVSPYTFRQDIKGLKDFPADNLSFLFGVPGYSCMVYNQLIEIPAQSVTLQKLTLKRKRHSGIPDPANLLCVEDIDRLLSDVARENQLLVNAHYSIMVCAERDKIGKAVNFIEASLFQQGIIPSRNAYNQLELFRCALPGNGIELKKYDWFLTTADAALCFFFKESLIVDDPSDFLLYFTDRQGTPVAIDISDLPMQTGRLKNRNRFILGGSGTGKSYCVNNIVQQYLGYNMDVVIVDVGHSYSGLCGTYGGKYITYSEEKPITMNPFAIDESEYNIEKKDFLITLISLLWKGADGSVSSIERDVIAQVVSAYYGDYFGLSLPSIEKLDFNSFYEFALRKIPAIKEQEQIPFDLEEFRFVLKKFYLGGEFDTILNEAADQSLFSEPFIVYEIDAVQENKVLFPIVTLIIMDLFIQKMRHRTSRRKALILEEAWRAISSPLMSHFLLYLNKTVRKFWGEIIEVTQEVGDIMGNPIIKDSIINNSDTVILLQQKEADLKKVAELLSINDIELKKILTINRLDNREGRSRFNEFYIRRGTVGEVYGVEVSMHHHLAFTTEKPEKNALETYVAKFGNYFDGISAMVDDLKSSGLSLSAFVSQVNSQQINN
ncbi:TraG family conjugative transposon ATPase [Pedobacter paludis]|uniref:Conjugal transfer protein TraG n=1 Tax=Pedobacter paludis TaxID=2203212 RepID=A0A317F2Z1_9SPHI|nr:TraG family conjugative transposon ATPase [Pedobacter paludis]PWS32663.1 conjugal transfer protein TraG [Pedobacter paludis]